MAARPPIPLPAPPALSGPIASPGTGTRETATATPTDRPAEQITATISLFRQVNNPVRVRPTAGVLGMLALPAPRVSTSALYPVCSTASTSCRAGTDAGTVASACPVAKFTVATTLSIPLSFFSTRAAHAAHVIPPIAKPTWRGVDDVSSWPLRMTLDACLQPEPDRCLRRAPPGLRTRRGLGALCAAGSGAHTRLPQQEIYTSQKAIRTRKAQGIPSLFQANTLLGFSIYLPRV